MKRFLRGRYRRGNSSHIFTDRLWIWPLALLFAFLWFDVEWCMATTFTAFSRAETYVNAILLALLISFPAMLWGCRRIQLILLIAVSVWLECNLMYSRTYFAAIPPDSYAMASNLSDFTASVTDSLRPADCGFIIIILAAALVGLRHSPRRRPREIASRRRAYLCLTLLMAVTSGALLLSRGGLMKAWDDLENCHHHSCRVPMFTVVGSILHDIMAEHAALDPAEVAEIQRWLDIHGAFRAGESSPDSDTTALPDSLRRYDSMVLILCESLESWPVGLTLEGKEITPNLNRLIADSTTLYAPHVVSQVGPGRSIDAQLIINAGLLPMQRGVYSMKVPFNRYYTLNRAMTLRNPATRSYLLTVDKPVVWNQGAVASSFGIDTLLTKADWRMEEMAGGYRLKLGDRAFMRQLTEKMAAGEIWPDGQPAFLQIVTYSGHNPFILPDSLDNLRLTGDYPDIARRYLTVARYTDESLGILLDYLRSRSDYDRTLIVITGDHEGLADYRNDLTRTLPFVSPDQHVPLIIANALPDSSLDSATPGISSRIDHIAGQIDIYPTLLDLLGDTRYPWRGLGTSILSPSHPRTAINSAGLTEGDTISLDPATLTHLRDSRTISDRILRHDLLARP